MFKVMLVDDEPIIVEGLSRSIPWEKFQCQVVATANDGVEGIEKIKKFKPELMFLDICMPEMDGLSMVAAIKSQYEDLEISILTGFRDFDYAKEAIRLGVTRFLLKPSNMEEIEEAITVMCENVKKKQENLVIPSKVEQNENKENKEESPSSFIVKNALNYIKENYADHLSLCDVAEKTYVSQWHLSKLLNKYTNQSFSEILNQVRIEEAKKLLSDPALRIGEIAEKVGFLDLAHFSRVFKKLEGVSANEYRNAT